MTTLIVIIFSRRYTSLMPKDTIRSTLESFGLTDKEVTIYLLLLQLGTAPASSLSDRSDIPRSTAQFTCQQLAKRGLLRMVQKANTYLFTPEPPEKLQMLLQKQQEDLAEKEHELHRIIGELKAMQNPHSSLPRVRFYEGADGIAAAYDAVLEDLQEGDEVVTYVKVMESGEGTPEIRSVLDGFIKKRIRKKVRSRLITPAAPAGRALQKSDAQSLRETRLVPEDAFPISAAEIFIYKDKMYAMAFEKNALFATIVQNQSLATMQKAAFELAWERAKETNDAMVRASSPRRT